MLSQQLINQCLADGTFVMCGCNCGCVRCNGNGFVGNCNISMSEYEPREPESVKAKYRDGRAKNGNPQKTTIEDRWLIRVDHENGMTQMELAAKYSLSQSTISDILNRKFKRSI